MSLAGYSQRGLALALRTDRSLIFKWRTGRVREVKAAHHQQALAELLNTPRDYWVTPHENNRHPG